MTDDKPSAKNMERVDWKTIPSRITIGKEEIEANLNPKEFFDKWTEKHKRAIETFTLSDPGYCGLDPLVTGKRDPYWPRCSAHDVHYEKLKAANPDRTNMQVQAEFAKGVLSTAASGLYAFLTAPIYLVIGCIGGMARWTQLERRNAKARGEKLPSNTPED